MPVYHRELGFSFIVYTDDHLPMHIHVFHGGEEMLIDLGETAWQQDENGNDILVALELPSTRDIRTMRRANRRRALAIAVKEQQKLIEAWREIHG